MKLTKKLETEIRQVMDEYWGSYLKGDLEKWAHFLPDNYRNIGSTEEEIWNSKEEMMNYSKAIIHQMAGAVETRNKQVQIIPLDPYFMVHEFQDFYINTGKEWVFYAKFRLSSLIQKTDDGWKVLHQHGSVPDSKAQDGESIGFEKISKENLELREAVKRRTIELEQKNRELEIEACLERVRAIAMSMTRPDDMLDVCRIISEQLELLGTKQIRNVQTAIFHKDKGTYLNFEYYKLHDKSLITEVDYTQDEMTSRFASRMQNGAGEYFTESLAGKNLTDWFEYQKTTVQFADSYLAKASSLNYYWFSLGAIALGISSYAPLKEEEISLFKRFRNVFELSYRRFLDIQKSEAQTRESQIELGLERVRARTMAMQKSDELRECVLVIYEQLQHLDFDSNACNIIIIDNESGDTHYWVSGFTQKIFPEGYHVPYLHHAYHENLLSACRKNEKYVVMEYSGKMKQSFDEIFFTQTDFRNIPEQAKQVMIGLKTVKLSTAFFTYGALQVLGPEALSEDKAAILQRFGKVFEQTYTRFLDLQKAESQAREAQIEVALEKVRSRTMAMHKSEELGEAAVLLYKELKSLGITRFLNCGYVEVDEENSIQHGWMTKTDGTQLEGYTIPLVGDEVLQVRYDAWKRKETIFYQEVGGNKLKNHTEFTSPHLGSKEVDDMVRSQFPDPTIYYCGNFSHGYLHVITGTLLNAEEESLLTRFTRVFEMTYQRFLDLQKAEAQSREAQIELGLERVRARAMAMQKSDELKELIGTVFTELTRLDLVLARCLIMIYDPSTKDSTWWMANSEAPSEPIGLVVQYHEHPTYLAYVKAWQERTLKWEYVLESEIKNDWDDFLFTETGLKALPDFVIAGMKAPDKVYLNSSFNSFGNLTLATLDPLSGEHFNIMLRFAKVFDLTYTRFNDLQKAEAQSREARIEASLERVRAKAMSMHSSQDLADTIGLFYHELELFSITPRRCGVGLLNKETRIAELSTMNTNEQGKSIELIGKIKMEGHRVLEGVYENWILNKEYHPVLRGSEIKEYYQLLRPQIAFPDYPGDTVQYGYFFFFPEGAVYAWTDKEMGDDELKIYRRFTSVLSLTYKRYKDLQQAEELAQQAEQDLVNLKAEKKKTEDALAELKTTQFQLIHAEKMASLGELTAGIAHEIQNPLNFVNNFSEVSTELVAEMNDEIKKGNLEDAAAIAHDLKKNLEKINHHGKRAGDIVKGMLQHSRSGAATKEPTDINKLTDEYVRLGYHGLRAKDKTFNITLQTDYDEEIGNISIIPQDIGRVVLNLITNASYVVTEKKKLGIAGYEPTVSISTKKNGDTISISVKDNGNGIPQKVFDKIFQPFFTTKPAGQGTGLGLSLAYDIVKAHGGELKAETTEGHGSTFFIQLPVN